MPVGTPPQNFAFLPAWPLNNSWIWDGRIRCASSISNAAYLTRRGGFFMKSQSTTFLSSTDPFSEGPIVVDGAPATDSVILSANATLTNFMFGIPNIDWADGTHGLNHTWSMFWGLEGVSPPTQMNGGLVFGGYDAAKAQGSNLTRKLSAPTVECPSGMLVTVSDLLLDFPNGSSASMLQGYPLSCCVLPNDPLMMGLPYSDYYDRFSGLTSSRSVGISPGVNINCMLYPPDNVFGGGVTVRFDGLSVRIPNNQLVLPNLEVANSGQVIFNTSYREVLIGFDQNYHQSGMLGRAFLKAAYLLVNQDANTFTLWNARPTTDIDLRPIVTHEVAASCEPNITTTINPQQHQGSKGISAGAIAGIVIGAFAVVALVGALVSYRKRRRSPLVELDNDMAVLSRKRAPLAELQSEPVSHSPHEIVPPPPQEMWSGR